MQVKTKAIVISSLKYQEKSLIVKCFTQTDGLKSYFVSNAFSAQNTKQRNAYFQPLTILDVEAIHKNKNKLERFKEIKLAIAYKSIHLDVYKSAIALFVSEIINNSIHEEEKNEPLFNFLEAALLWLDTNDRTANFHLILMIEMTKFLGFYPDVSKIEFPFFDTKEGMFSQFQTIDSLPKEETFLLKKLISLKFNTSENVFKINQRQMLLSILIHYYTIHIDNFRKPKSLDVLKEVFF